MAIKININKPQEDFDIGGVIVTGVLDDTAIKEVLRLKESDLNDEAEKLKRDFDKAEETSENYEDFATKTIELYDKVYSPLFSEGAVVKVYAVVDDILATIDSFEQALDYLMTKVSKEREAKRKKTIKKYMHPKK